MKTACILLTFLFVPTLALAQSDFDGYDAPPGPCHQPVPLLPSDFGFSQHHSSTVAEGYLRGSAGWLHARGNCLVNRQQAALLAEQARWLDLSNDWRRIALHDWKLAHRASRLEAKRLKNLAARPEKYRVAYELSSDQLDRVRGKIAWPEALRAARYENLRHRLDELFREQAGYDGAPPTSDSSEIERESQRLIREFDRNRAEVSPKEYLAAQKFLRGLKYEPLFRSQVF